MSTLNSQSCVVALASPAFSQEQAFCRGGRVIAPFVSMARREKSRDRSRRRERSRKGRSRSRGRERRCSRGRERRRSSSRSESETPERASVRTEAPDVENTRGGGGGDNALIRRAAALRTKYRQRPHFDADSGHADRMPSRQPRWSRSQRLSLPGADFQDPHCRL